MKMITGSDIRREMNLFLEEIDRLDEKFLKKSDPSIVVSIALEELSVSFSKLKASYEANAKDRNKMVPEALKLFQSILASADKAKKELMAFQANGDPEDTNA